MSRCHNTTICCLFLATAPLAVGAETINHPGPYRPSTVELREDPAVLIGLDEAAYAKMSMDDPLLKLAYCRVLIMDMGKYGPLGHTETLALSDMRRRGDAVTPMLLELAKENQETVFEISLLLNIDEVGSMALDPYIEYARALLRERTQTMSAITASTASSLLAKHGSKADIELLKKVIEERSYVAGRVTRDLRSLERRLDSQQQKPKSSNMVGTLPRGAITDNDANSAPRSSTPKRGEEPTSRNWTVWGLLIITAISMLWVLSKKGIR